MEAFNFTADDLAYNKAGKLSPRQAARYRKANGAGKVFFFFLMLGVGAGAFFVLRPFVLQGLSIADNLGRLIGGVVLVGLTLLFLYFLFEKAEPVIISAQGEAQFVSRESETTDGQGHTTSSTSYYVSLGDHEFGVESSKFQAFKQGHMYAIYKEVFIGILSAEYIGPPND